MRFVVALFFALGLILPADAQFYTYGPGGAGYGPVSSGGGSGAFNISSISLSTQTYAGGTYSGTASIVMTGGTVTGATAVSLSTTQGGCNGTNGANNGNFSFSGFGLSGSGLSGPQAICVLATVPGAGNTPFGQAFTITGTGSPTITAVTLDDTSFIGSLASGTVIANVGVTETGGSFSGTIALSGTDASFFTLSSSSLPATLKTSGTVTAGGGSGTNGAYVFTITATQGGAIGSPFAQSFTQNSWAGDGDTQGFGVSQYSLRAMTATKAATGTLALINLRDTTTGETCDVLSKLNGNMGLTTNCSASGNGKTVSAWLGSDTAAVPTWYNQKSGSGCDVTQATTSLQPTLSLSPLGVSFNGSTQYLHCGGLTNQVAPLSFVAAIRPHGAGSANDGTIVANTQSSSGSPGVWFGHVLFWESGGTNSHKTNYTSANNNVFGQAFSTNTLAVDTYGSLAGVSTSTSNRVAYMTAGAGSADTTSLNPGVDDSLTLGAVIHNGTTDTFYNGMIDEVHFVGADATSNITAMCHSHYIYGWSATSC